MQFALFACAAVLAVTFASTNISDKGTDVLSGSGEESSSVEEVGVSVNTEASSEEGANHGATGSSEDSSSVEESAICEATTKGGNSNIVDSKVAINEPTEREGNSDKCATNELSANEGNTPVQVKNEISSDEKGLSTEFVMNFVIENLSQLTKTLNEKKADSERKKEEKVSSLPSVAITDASERTCIGYDSSRLPKSRLCNSRPALSETTSPSPTEEKPLPEKVESVKKEQPLVRKPTTPKRRQKPTNVRFEEKRQKLIGRMRRFIDKNSDHPLNKLLGKIMGVLSIFDEAMMDKAWKAFKKERQLAIHYDFSRLLYSLGTLNKYVSTKHSKAQPTIHYAPISGESLDIHQDSRFDKIAKSCLKLSQKQNIGKLDFLFFVELLMDLFELHALYDAVEVDIFSPIYELFLKWEVASCGFSIKAKRTNELSEFYLNQSKDLKEELEKVISRLTNNNYLMAGELQINRFKRAEKLPKRNIPQAKNTKVTNNLQNTALSFTRVSRQEFLKVFFTFFVVLLFMQLAKEALVEVPRIFC